MRTERKMAIVGVNKDQNGRIFRVIEFMYDFDERGVTDNWRFRKLELYERDLMSAMRQGIRVINGVVEKRKDKYEVVGNHGSFDRFKHGMEVVILSEIKYLGEDRVIGYRVATANGQVQRMKKSDLLSACARAISKGIEFPIQNASFVKNNGKPFIRRNNSDGNINDDGGITNELLVREENRYTTYKKENKEPEVKAGNEKLDKINDMYTKEQLEVIKRTRAKHKQKWRLITNPKLSAEQMAVLSKGLDKGVDISLINKPEFKYPAMKIYIEDMYYGLDIRYYLNPEYNVYQIEEMGLAYEEGLDLAKMADPKNSVESMRELRIRLERDIWKECLVNDDGTWEEIKQ